MSDVVQKCDCRSYNRPDLGGSVDEVSINPRGYFKGPNRDVCVDACIEHVIRKLWENGVHTTHSCCGHNGAFGAPSIGIKNYHSLVQAVALIRQVDNREFRLFFDLPRRNESK